MKTPRSLILLISLALVLSLTFTAPAYAEETSSRNVNVYQGQGFALRTLREEGTERIVGVVFRGMYFGNSGIEVSVQIYGGDEFTIDFPVNEDPAKLTAPQQAVQTKLIGLATDINGFIVRIDNLSNTQYGGTDGAPVSDIWRYNNANYGDVVEISEDTYNMLNVAREMYTVTNGAFNPAVYRLVDLWGFSSRTYRKNGNLAYDRQWEVTDDNISYPLPDDKYVKAFGAPEFTAFGENAVKLTAENGKFYVTKNVAPASVDGVEYNQWLDLGGIAKGYVADGIRSMLTAEGISRYYVDAGTSSQVLGSNYEGGDFLLSIRDPYRKDWFYQPSVVGALTKNSTVSSSGQYERKFVTDGVEYAHIIDGAQGRPAQTGVNSITIIAPQSYSAATGDCLTTALTVMGKDSVVDFMNGYLKDNGIKVILTYETVNGGKQLLTNYAQSDLVEGDTFGEYAWSVKLDSDGNIVYDASAKAPVSSRDYTGWIIALGVIVVLAVAAVIVVHIVKGKGKTERNVLNAKKDKPFKIGDVGIYLAVALLIVVLFSVFFGTESEQIRAINVIDFTNSGEGELLFSYNVVRNEWIVYSDNTNQWTVDVTVEGNDVHVRFSRTVDGNEIFNTMIISRGTEVTVKMTDATCADKDCVYNFSALSAADRAIVCSPNRIKIITQ